MNAVISSVHELAKRHPYRRGAYLVLLLLAAVSDYAFSARTARSFVFVSMSDGGPLIERRFLPRRIRTEEALSAYVSEYLLGPSNLESRSLFVKGTRLASVLVRSGEAHIDLSAEAAFPPEPGVDVRDSLRILTKGIERNFPNLKHAKVYIEGHEPYAYEVLEGLSEESASKNRKSVDK